jgi:hypothetical protein
MHLAARDTHTLTRAAVAKAFAWEVACGRAHLICTENDDGKRHATPGDARLPWDFLAVLVEDDPRWQAVVATTSAAVMRNLEALAHERGYEAETPTLPTGIICAPIPTLPWSEAQAKQMRPVLARAIGTSTTITARLFPCIPCDLEDRLATNKLRDAQQLVARVLEMLSRAPDQLPADDRTTNGTSDSRRNAVHADANGSIDLWRRPPTTHRINNAHGNAHGTPKAAHTRRGHWQRFRTGKRDNPEPTYVTRWIEPTQVNGGQRRVKTHTIRERRDATP